MMFQTFGFLLVPRVRIAWAVLAGLLLAAGQLRANDPDWGTTPFTRHSDYQAVQVIRNPPDTGPIVGATNAYSLPLWRDGAERFVRLRGVVLNNTEDWLNPQAGYTAEVELGNLGGQAEFYVQAVDLAADSWDDGDFGGTACWMGQNYGNLSWKQNVAYSYQDAEWCNELNRLGVWHPDEPGLPSPPAAPLRAGDLVEIRARGGLHYNGKSNINEQHLPESYTDFDVVVLQPDYCPDLAALTTPLTLDELVDLDGGQSVPIFDETRATGGERYQSTRVKLVGVRFKDFNPAADWHSNGDSTADLTLEDASGRTLAIHLGRNASFDSPSLAPTGYFDVCGVLDQYSASGIDGYRLLAMNAGDFSPSDVPEPSSSVMLVVGIGCFALFGLGRRTHVAKR